MAFAEWLLIAFLALTPSENPVNVIDPPQGVTDSVSPQWAGPSSDTKGSKYIKKAPPLAAESGVCGPHR